MTTMAEIIQEHVIEAETIDEWIPEVICVCGFTGTTALYADHVTGKLSDAGFGSIQSSGVEPVRTYYRALYDGGKLWVETRNPKEAVRMSEGVDVVFEKLEVREYTRGWEPWTPS